MKSIERWHVRALTRARVGPTALCFLVAVAVVVSDAFASHKPSPRTGPIENVVVVVVGRILPTDAAATHQPSPGSVPLPLSKSPPPP